MQLTNQPAMQDFAYLIYLLDGLFANIQTYLSFEIFNM